MDRGRGAGRAAGGQGAEPSVEGSHLVLDGQATPFLKQWGDLDTC